MKVVGNIQYNMLNNGEYNEQAQKSSLNYTMKYNLAVGQRKIYIYDEINENTIFEIIYFLNLIVDIDNKINKKNPINIYINSMGGNVLDGFTLIDYIEHLKNQGYEINTINVGFAFSMGFVISLSGSRRYCYRNADYMYHEISGGIYNTLTKQQREMKYMAKLNSKLIDYIVAHSNLTKEELEVNNKTINDWYIDAKEALERNICDEIL